MYVHDRHVNVLHSMCSLTEVSSCPPSRSHAESPGINSESETSSLTADGAPRKYLPAVGTTPKCKSGRIGLPGSHWQMPDFWYKQLS